MEKKIILTVLIFCISLISDVFPAENEKSEDTKTEWRSKIQVLILDTSDDLPIENADIYIRSDLNKCKNDKFSKNVRSNKKGIANIDKIPCKNILIQVNAVGYFPFGKKYELNEINQKLEINLKKMNQDND